MKHLFFRIVDLLLLHAYVLTHWLLRDPGSLTYLVAPYVLRNSI